MKIKVDLKIFLFLVVFYLTKQIKIYSLLMIFALIHEFGHILAGLFLGMKIKKIEIMALGVRVSFQKNLEEYYKEEINKKIEKNKLIIAVSGPITNIFTAILFIIFPIEIKQVDILVYMNVLIALFNLLPIYPLDGGRILKSLLKFKFNTEQTLNYINHISNITIIILTAISSVLILYLKNIAFVFIIIYLWIISAKENKKYLTRRKIYQTIQKYSKKYWKKIKIIVNYT